MKKQEFKSYDDMRERYVPYAPEKFNFAFDVLDALAEEYPDKTALVHVDNDHVRRDFSFGQIARMSRQLANALAAQGIGRGDRVMLILYRRMRILDIHARSTPGRRSVPATNLLTVKDMVYRLDIGQIKAAMVEDSISERMVEAQIQCPSLITCVQVGAAPLPTGWLDYETISAQASDSFPPGRTRPATASPCSSSSPPAPRDSPRWSSTSQRYPLGRMNTASDDLTPGQVLAPDPLGNRLGQVVWGKIYWPVARRSAAIFVFDYPRNSSPTSCSRAMAPNTGLRPFARRPPSIAS